MHVAPLTAAGRRDEHVAGTSLLVERPGRRRGRARRAVRLVEAERSRASPLPGPSRTLVLWFNAGSTPRTAGHRARALVSVTQQVARRTLAARRPDTARRGSRPRPVRPSRLAWRDRGGGGARVRLRSSPSARRTPRESMRSPAPETPTRAGKIRRRPRAEISACWRPSRLLQAAEERVAGRVRRGRDKRSPPSSASARRRSPYLVWSIVRAEPARRTLSFAHGLRRSGCTPGRGDPPPSGLRGRLSSVRFRTRRILTRVERGARRILAGGYGGRENPATNDLSARHVGLPARGKTFIARRSPSTSTGCRGRRGVHRREHRLHRLGSTQPRFLRPRHPAGPRRGGAAWRAGRHARLLR